MEPTKLTDIKAAQADKDLASTKHQEVLGHTDNVAQVILSATSTLIKYLEGHTTKTEVVNQLESISTPDVKFVVEALQVLDDTLKTHENTDLTEVTDLMRQLVDEAKQIPKTLPEEKEQQFVDYSKQLTGMTDAIKAVEKVVKAQKLVAEAPIVNVPESSVHVDAPDLQPLQDGFKDVVSAVNDIVIPEYKTDTDAVQKLLKSSNSLLERILKKPVSSGGGGGSSWTAIGTNGLPAPLNLDGSGSLKITSGSDPLATTGTITVVDSSSVSTTVGSYQAVAIVSGTPTTNSFIIKPVSGLSSARIMITGTWTGTLALEKSADGGITYTTSTWKVQGSVYTTGTTTGNGMFDSVIGAATHVRVRATLAVTGTANIVIQTGSGVEAINVVNPVRLYDNTSGAVMTVKPASTAPLSTDTAIVVAQSPNSSLRRTANSAITSVVGATTSTQLLAQNTNRNGAYFYNDSTAILYLAYATAASLTAYTVQIAPNGFFEMPVEPVYTGAIFGIWSAVNGNCRITQLT